MAVRLLLFFSIGTLITIWLFTYVLVGIFWIYVLGLPLAALACWFYEKGRKRAWWRG